MSGYRQALYFAAHLWQRQSRYHVQSPFAYAVANELLTDRRHYYVFDHIEALRDKLLKNHQEITISDYGAGSHHQKSNKRKISSIARHAAIPPKWGAFLFRLAQWGPYPNMLELGTSLGMSAAYLAASSPNGKLVTLEGSDSIARLAEQHFQELSLTNIHLITGTFDAHLKQVCDAHGPFHLVHLDGNHRYAPTLQYYKQVQPYLSEESVVVLDDIHWSAEMHHAWQHLQQTNEPLLFIDLFYKGLIFKHPGLKQAEKWCLSLP